jgi:hypothetical protein
MNNTNIPCDVAAKELEIGDIIHLFGKNNHAPYHTATVYNVKDDLVFVVRPYVHTSSMITTGGVITYLGDEKFSFPRDERMHTLLQREDPENLYKTLRAIKEQIAVALDKNEVWRAKELLRQL